METRELFRKEKQAIRLMVRAMCANYDNEYGCLPLDGGCFMLGKLYADNILCRWFRNALLPLKPELEQILTGKPLSNMKSCQSCGALFAARGRKSYCSEKCTKLSRRESVARNARAYRQRKRQRNQLATINALDTATTGQELWEVQP